MEILKQFGFETQLFIAQVVNFLLIAYILKRFLYKPILKVLKDREDKIRQSMLDTEETSRTLKKTEEEKDKILKRTRIEAEKIINDSKDLAQVEKEKILKDAKEEADKIIQDAKIQAKLEMEKMENKITDLALSLSQKILNKVLSSLFSKKEKENILERAYESLEKESNYE